MANNKKENKIEKFTKEAIGKTLNQFNKEIGIADLVEVNKNQDRILNGILSQVNDENTEKTEKSNIITLDNSTDGIVELKEIQGDTNVNVSKIEEETPITHVIEDKEGSVINLNDITEGAINIDNIQGNTMVNCNKEADKELILMEDLSTEGYNNITLNKGVDGGLVDVALEGNTMVNVCDQKDPVAITKSYTVETGNHVALQGEYDGKCRPIVNGNTLVNLSEINTATLSPSNTMVSTGISMLKPSTTYTSILNIKTNTLSPGDGTSIVGALYVDNGNNQNKIELGYTGVIKSIFTTNGDISSYNFTTRVRLNSSPTEGSMEIEEILLEGDYTNKSLPGYFEGLKSSFEDKVVPENIATSLSSNNVGSYSDVSCYTNLSRTCNNGDIITISFEITNVGASSSIKVGYGRNNAIQILNTTKIGRYTVTYDGKGASGDKLYIFTDNADTFVINNVYVVEGDYTNYDFSDYDPTKAGKYKIDYVVTGKNKFDINKLIEACSNKSTINITINNNNSFTIQSTSPYVSNTLVDFGLDMSKQYSIKYDNPNNAFVITQVENGFNFYVNPKYDGTIVNLQIEEGSTVTTYEPYKEYKKTFYLNSPLLEGDTIEQQGDNVVHVHRYKEVVLNDSSIKEILHHDGSTYRVDTTISNFKLSGEIISILPTTPDRVIENRFDKAIGIWQRTIFITSTTFTTLDEFKTYLQSNPVPIVYQLATPQYEVISQNDTILCDSYVNGHLDVDSVVPIKRVDFRAINMPIKYLYLSTEYIIQFESDNVGKIDLITLNSYAGVVSDYNVTKGINKLNITTFSESVDNGLIFYGIGFNASNIVVTEATDQDFGYFEGMKSVGECEDLEVVSSNKNLVNDEFIEWHNSVIFDGNEIEFSAESSKINKIKAKPNTQYTFGYKCKILSGGYCLFKLNYTDGTSYVVWSREDDIGINQYSDFITITSSPNKTLSSFAVYGNSNKSRLTDFIIVEGDTATDYIPHTHNTQTLTHEPLRSVGDTKDKYVLIDGKWYIERNCGEYIIPQDTVWTKTPHMASGDYVRYKFNMDSPIDIKYNYLDSKQIAKSSILPFGYPNGWASCSKNEIQIISKDSNELYTQVNLSTVKQVASLLNGSSIIYPKNAPTYEPIDYNPFTVYSDTTHISNNSTIPCNMAIKNTGFNCLLKPSTTYTVSSNLGLNTVTTPSTLSEDCLRFMDTDTSDVTTMRDVMVLEGDYTTGKPLPSHFSGIESAFEQEYDEGVGKYKVKAKVVGKNLFNGVIVNNKTEYIECQPNTPYYCVTSQGSFIWYYDKNKKVIGAFDSGKPSPYNAKYLVKILANVPENELKTVQIEQGTQATPYEPYKESIIEFYIDEPLRGVGDVKDRVYVKNDKVIVERKCGSVTFDGSEDEGWHRYSDRLYGTNQNTWVFRKPLDVVKSRDLLLYCDKLNSCKGTQYDYNKELIYSYNDGNIWVHLYTETFGATKDLSLVESENKFEQWLQSNPITVVYQLAEPTYEEVEYSESRLFLNTYNNSTLFYESNIPVSNTSFKPLWEELVYLKNSTKYYIQFNSTASGTVVFNLGGTEVTKDIVEGYNNIAIDTPAETTNLLTIDGHGIKISEVVVSESVCGGHYLGLQSCFEEHIENGKYRVLLRGIALDGSKVNGIKLYLDEPLRGIENVKDRLCIKDGKLMVERNCGSATFDGSEDERWGIQSSLTTNLCSQYYIRVDYSDKNKNIVLNYINDTFKKLGTRYGEKADKEGMYTSWGGLYINIFNSKLSEISNSGIKQWLQSNPVSVVYQLATPVYEEATNEYGLPIVLEGYENGIVYIDSAVIPTTSIKYTSNNVLATTLSEAEEQNNSTQEDINMNVITYMMDIDMMLTDMEMSNDISVMAVRRDSSNENMLDRMSDEDKKVYRDNTVVMLEKMITAKALEKEDIERRINMYYNKNRISKEQYKYLKSLL